MIFCLRCSETLETLQERSIAFQLRISNEELAESKALFIECGFIDEKWNVLNWEKRQYDSDCSTERVRRFRKQKKDETFQKRSALLQNVPNETNGTKRNVQEEKRREEIREEETNTLTPEMVSRAVLETLFLSGKELVRVLDDICRAEMKAGKDPEALRDELVASWETFAPTRDRFSPSAEKFFGQGLWRKPKAKQPRPVVARKKTLQEETLDKWRGDWPGMSESEKVEAPLWVRQVIESVNL